MRAPPNARVVFQDCRPRFRRAAGTYSPARAPRTGAASEHQYAPRSPTMRLSILVETAYRGLVFACRPRFGRAAGAYSRAGVRCGRGRSLRDCRPHGPRLRIWHGRVEVGGGGAWMLRVARGGGRGGVAGGVEEGEGGEGQWGGAGERRRGFR
jgi:hypothetical protein